MKANREHLPDPILEIGSRLMGSGAISVRNGLDSSPATLCHGDFRLDNLFFLDSDVTGASRIAVIDWTGLRRGPGMWDLSHAICLGMDPEVRRASERDCLTAYCQTLAENGIPGYTLGMAMRDYRMSLLTHLQKLARSFVFEVVNDGHARLRDVQRTRVISSVLDHCTPEMIS